MPDNRFDRRRFVRLLAGGIAAGGATLLQACSASVPSTPATAAPNNPTQPATKPTTSGAATTSAPAAAAPTATSAAPAQKPAATTSVSRTVQLPNRFPLVGIKPDLPPSADGLIDAAFVNYPADPPKTVQDTPGGGGEVNVVTWTTSAAPTPLDSNALWQAVNKELGVDLKI